MEKKYVHRNYTHQIDMFQTTRLGGFLKRVHFSDCKFYTQSLVQCWTHTHSPLFSSVKWILTQTAVSSRRLKEARPSVLCGNAVLLPLAIHLFIPLTFLFFSHPVRLVEDVDVCEDVLQLELVLWEL